MWIFLHWHNIKCYRQAINGFDFHREMTFFVYVRFHSSNSKRGDTSFTVYDKHTYSIGNSARYLLLCPAT
jgi:hypothetical protein